MRRFRDTFRLLLDYARQRLGCQPTDLLVIDINVGLVAGFLMLRLRGRGDAKRHPQFA